MRIRDLINIPDGVTLNGRTRADFRKASDAAINAIESKYDKAIDDCIDFGMYPVECDEEVEAFLDQHASRLIFPEEQNDRKGNTQ